MLSELGTSYLNLFGPIVLTEILQLDQVQELLYRFHHPRKKRPSTLQIIILVGGLCVPTMDRCVFRNRRRDLLGYYGGADDFRRNLRCGDDNLFNAGKAADIFSS